MSTALTWEGHSFPHMCIWPISRLIPDTHSHSDLGPCRVQGLPVHEQGASPVPWIPCTIIERLHALEGDPQPFTNSMKTVAGSIGAGAVHVHNTLSLMISAW